MVGGGWVKSVLPSYQNRQISALDERRLTHLTLVFSFFSFLFSLFLFSSQFHKYLSLFSRKLVLAGRSQSPRRSLAVPSRVFLRAAPLFSLGIVHILKKFAPRLGKKGSRPGGSPYSPANNEHSG